MTTTPAPTPPAGMPPGHYEGLDQALVVKYRPVCEWFALCTRPSAGTVLHPILGAVPICAPCADRMGYSDEVGLWLESE